MSCGSMAVVNELPDTRERSLCLTALEEAHMWMHACIAKNADHFKTSEKDEGERQRVEETDG